VPLYPMLYGIITSFLFGSVAGVVIAWKLSERRMTQTPPKESLPVFAHEAPPAVSATARRGHLRRVA
jgi:H+/gluconate symporter-like permease